MGDSVEDPAARWAGSPSARSRARSIAMAASYPDATPERSDLIVLWGPIQILGHCIDRIPRSIRFGAVGSVCARFQLAVLGLLVRAQVEAHIANTLAFLASTQIDFVPSSLITWRDRRLPTRSRSLIGRRLVGYNTLALGSLIINQVAFAVALRALPYLGAALVGILAGMLLTYMISGHLLFRRTFTPPVSA